MPEIEIHTVYELAGGMAAFVRLADSFYDRVAEDPLLRPLFPTDFAAPKERLALFLAQYFGGPTTYSDQRGHPRLRMRHLPFRIGQPERDAWLKQMTAAVESLDLAPGVRKALLDYFETASTAMINQPAP